MIAPPEATQTEAPSELSTQEPVELPSEKEFAALLANDGPIRILGFDGYDVEVGYNIYFKLAC
jgi:hypothetical protein